MASKHNSNSKTELITLSEQYDIMKTGIGMDKTHAALNQLSEPGSYGLIIHFGVSGSLTEELAVKSLIYSHTYCTLNKKLIDLPRYIRKTLPGLQEVCFYTSDKAITDHNSRLRAAASGAKAVDMESYAVAQFCQQQQIPLLSLRCISDQAGDSAEIDFKQHYETAARSLQSYLLKHFLKHKE